VGRETPGYFHGSNNSEVSTQTSNSMKSDKKKSTQQIGKCGELLVQYLLLRHGVESSPMTTDSGIDLVAYSANMRKALTIQVKTNLKPKPGGGKGRLSLDWWAPQVTKAQFYAFVDLNSQEVWLMNHLELARLAQQSPKGRYHFFMILDPNAKKRADGKRFRKFEFEKYRLQNRIEKIFG